MKYELSQTGIKRFSYEVQFYFESSLDKSRKVQWCYFESRFWMKSLQIYTNWPVWATPSVYWGWPRCPVVSSCTARCLSAAWASTHTDHRQPCTAHGSWPRPSTETSAYARKILQTWTESMNELKQKYTARKNINLCPSTIQFQH